MKAECSNCGNRMPGLYRLVYDGERKKSNAKLLCGDCRGRHAFDREAGA